MISEIAKKQQERFWAARQSKQKMTWEQKRNASKERFRQFSLPEGAKEYEDTLDGIPVQYVCLQGTEQDKILFYIHGGGFSNGSLSGRFWGSPEAGLAAGEAADFILSLLNI